MLKRTHFCSFVFYHNRMLKFHFGLLEIVERVTLELIQFRIRIQEYEKKQAIQFSIE